MGRKFKVFLDSGANIHSKYEREVDLDELGIEEDWDEMSEEEKNEVMQEIAWENMEWGFYEIE
ncbi:hypothetical protein PGS10_11660 [Klebsiella sp. 141153]|uniref:DUF7167 family protein n=1 Tax=Klebsiella sp. 141153 TaxID=3020033 RepID=UPI0029286D2B|nr:hypothetical protein [Klebsiella sp. 141153]MDU9355298.1 hypothetical protein [Klebsiella sp. 141153]